jgi:hypothetical protein
LRLVRARPEIAERDEAGRAADIADGHPRQSIGL